MKFVTGLILGFVVANLESFSGIANKLADGLEALAAKLHAAADSAEEG